MLHKTTISRGEIAWRVRNADAAGVPILLNHGAAGQKEVWSPLSRRLAAALPGRPVVFFDLPGHGQSSPEGRNTVEDYAADVREFIETENWPQVDFVGHSMGGAIAQALCADCPGRIRRLVLIGTGPKLGVAEIIFQLLPHQADQAYELVRQVAYGPEISPKVLELSLRQMKAGNPHVALGDFQACNSWNAGERLAAIQTPTLVVIGELDNLVSTQRSRQLTAGIAGAKEILLPRTGHMIPLERDRELCDLLVGHLGD